ncbi:septal ring lytic transglycosylase RlpA family protein [Streptobacillus felis]|uniref:Probable endolytic peptidoglycan transglycosylase RlpA n=1 Tax=Streptobacillus felis TaxID=1384509 RepID=A0A7Z0PFB8_9FUSO|nr:septal ring lytic transglycosylase RlpA family protein [Streptobacillus felis]NYV28228.1 septal ring lytic transglycosylase RlpA family protein [Streptobacillus felis]
MRKLLVILLLGLTFSSVNANENINSSHIENVEVNNSDIKELISELKGEQEENKDKAYDLNIEIKEQSPVEEETDKKKENKEENETQEVVETKVYETGIASYYGERWNGRKTASGEIFDTWKISAAHKKLPFGTKVKVTNIKNGKSVIVRINDRGPFVKGRVIDLSKAAFKQIEDLNKGITKVKLEIVK